MLTEGHLRELVESVAATAPDPALLPDALFVAEPKRVPPRWRPRSWVPALGVAAVALVALLCVAWFLSLVSSGGGTAGKFSTTSGAVGADAAPSTTVPGFSDFSAADAAGGTTGAQGATAAQG